MNFNANDIILIHNHSLTTPGKVYTVLYTQERTKTQWDPPDSGAYVEWLAFTNDVGVTDFVPASQCELKKFLQLLDEIDEIIKEGES